ncbi:hypothetical protein KUCAC02_020916, partial [Chaenocephalus aceratus]
VEAPRRALCLGRGAPDTTVAGPGPSQWPSTQKPTHWDNGLGSEWGWMAELRRTKHGDAVRGSGYYETLHYVTLK